jgi:PBP4 family serine-type D-alanyl-D-alanine carboxypeptidase
VKTVTVTNKLSQNHCADQLFKLTGWKVGKKGTFATGEMAARTLFEDLRIQDIDPFQMVDGSGLSRGNCFSAHTLVSMLSGVYQAAFRDIFIRSLPIAGVDGSLENRLTDEPYRSRVRGKTGWIREVSALSGYVQALTGEVFAFSILFNGYRGRNATMKSIQDRICRIIVEG